ncbi:MAG TPA: NADH-quinone oxidoreductase subunit D [Tepidisphaeraceae bacterium]|nr:NADH-quinone oxidoreductase subunit D [Tepidisphaeraceae bacterium]
MTTEQSGEGILTGQRYTLERDEQQSDRWILNFGPQHPATHTTLRLVLILDGERIVDCVPDIGYLHSGFEKMGEVHDLNQYVTVTDRMNYLSPVMNNLVWHGTWEKLYGIELTPRCKVIRTIVGELARIQDHVLSVGASALDLGAFTPFLYLFEDREIVYDLMEEISGARYMNSYTRLGGLKSDITPEWPGHVREFLKRVPKTLDDCEGLLLRNRIFIERLRGVGYVNKEEATNWSLTGPIARASGVVRDIRKDEPYLCFEENWDGKGSSPVEFKVPVCEMGDCYGRFVVRMEEIRQSLHIIDQLIDNIPAGPVNVAPDEKLNLPDKTEVWGSIEGLIHHFETVMWNRGWTPPIGETYGCIESPNGELGFYVASNGGRSAYRARLRPPSFINYQCFRDLIRGHQISDIVAVLGSLNIIAAELDR